MRIVVRQDESGQWWWTAVADDGRPAAVSPMYRSRTECVRSLAELRVEGPAAPITYEENYAARPGTWTISNLSPSGS
jgi:uncharacterized protein YegP (UPF0339 family)